MKQWRVRQGHTYPADKVKHVFYKGGREFSATDERVSAYRYMLDEITPKTEEAGPPQLVPAAMPPELPAKRKRGRPPKVIRMIDEAPENRAM